LAIRLYHVTSNDSAEAIFNHGFCDGIGHSICHGVRLSNYPLDCNSFNKPGASQTLAVDVQLTREELFGTYEVIELGKPYREFCIPSSVLNGNIEITILTDEQTCGIEQEQVWNDYPQVNRCCTSMGITEMR
jgi:hypothetical protein